jgi:hypothetical protein
MPIDNISLLISLKALSTHYNRKAAHSRPAQSPAFAASFLTHFQALLYRAVTSTFLFLKVVSACQTTAVQHPPTGQISLKSYLTLTYRNSMVSKSWELRFGVCHEKVK